MQKGVLCYFAGRGQQASSVPILQIMKQIAFHFYLQILRRGRQFTHSSTKKIHGLLPHGA